MSLDTIVVKGKKSPFPLQEFQEDLLRDEGDRFTPYRDSLGNWTNGRGHFIGDDRALDVWRKSFPPSGIITPVQLQVILGQDISETLTVLDRAIPWWRYLSPVRQRVIANMCFNMGWGALPKHGLHTFGATLDAVEHGWWDVAAKHMMDSAWASQVGSRAKRLAFMMETGTDKFPKSGGYL